jgi:terminase small subunit / prophage DNA-packing protein
MPTYRSPTTVRARNRLLKEQAEWARLKNARLAGEPVDVKTVQDQRLSCIVRLRGALLAIPARVQQHAPHLNAADIAVFDQEIRAALEAPADDHEAYDTSEERLPGVDDADL